MGQALFDDMDEAGKLSGGSVLPDPLTDFKVRQDQLARRRKLAEQLVQSAMQGDGGQGYHGGRVYAVGNQLGNVVSSIAGTMLGNQLDQQQQDLAARQREYNEQVLQGIPAEGPERQQAQLRAMQNPSLRDIIKAQMGIDENEAKRIEAGEQAAANRVETAAEKEANREFLKQQKELDRQNRLDIRQTPTIHISQGGGGSRQGATSAPDGKPLSAAQEKSALELGSNRSTLQMLSDTFKDEYAGDLRSTLQRKFGEVAGGAAPQATQNMTRWWADQAMFDELPQRHELFGATLTAGEKAAWAGAAISPNMSPDKIRERLAIRAKIYDAAEERMRGSVAAGGKSTKQFDAAVGKPKSQQSGALTPAEQAELDALRAKHGRK